MTQPLELHINPIRKRKRKRKAVSRRKRVSRARRNPHRSRSHLYCVAAMVRTGPKRFKTYYWNGRQFTREKSETRHYSQVQAMGIARKLLPNLSPKVYALRIERKP